MSQFNQVREQFLARARQYFIVPALRPDDKLMAVRPDRLKAGPASPPAHGEAGA